jgi:hypothetical protein
MVDLSWMDQKESAVRVGDSILIPISDLLGSTTKQTLPLQQINPEYAL